MGDGQDSESHAIIRPPLATLWQPSAPSGTVRDGSPLKKVKSDESPEFLSAMALAAASAGGDRIGRSGRTARPRSIECLAASRSDPERSGEQDVAIAAWSHLFKATCSEQAVLRAGRLLVKQGRTSEACDLYRDAASLGLTSEQLRRAYADAAGRNHDWELSSELWRSVVDDCPGDDIVHAKLVRAIDEAQAARPNIDRMKRTRCFDSRAGPAGRRKRNKRSTRRHFVPTVHRRVSHTRAVVDREPPQLELHGPNHRRTQRAPGTGGRTLDTSAIHRRPGATDTDLLPRYAAELLEWADVVFVEWVNEAAGWLMTASTITRRS